jgi:hypothetical protein
VTVTVTHRSAPLVASSAPAASSAATRVVILARGPAKRSESSVSAWRARSICSVAGDLVTVLLGA